MSIETEISILKMNAFGTANMVMLDAVATKGGGTDYIVWTLKNAEEIMNSNYFNRGYFRTQVDRVFEALSLFDKFYGLLADQREFYVTNRM